jgi:hypothetical protein
MSVAIEPPFCVQTLPCGSLQLSTTVATVWLLPVCNVMLVDGVINVHAII